MSQTITAIFENGVFKPLEEVKIKEHEKVEIKILSRDEWQKRFNRIIKKIHKKTAQYSPEEIEADIADAIREVRAKKRAR
jgi:predicted DNA-binding antitoxin AbrB/MazE fold protein